MTCTDTIFGRYNADVGHCPHLEIPRPGCRWPPRQVGAVRCVV